MANPFDLIAVGGTGQAFLLELCLGRSKRGAEAPFPEQFWVVDPDTKTNDGDRWYVSGALERALKNLDLRFDDYICKPRLPRGAGSENLLRHGFADGWGILGPALTSGEKDNIDVRKGFFAVPRLGAVWTSKHEFEPPHEFPEFLRAPFLMDASKKPLIIVGSLAGGTGSGLLPMLLSRVRDGLVAHWARPVVALVFLPWFNPEQAPLRADLPGFKPVEWKQCIRNAAFGILTLDDLTRRLQRRFTEEGPTPSTGSTSCVLCGIPASIAKEQAPLEYSSEFPDGTLHPLFRAAAEFVETVTAPVAPVAARAPASLAQIGTIALPMQEAPVDWMDVTWGERRIPTVCLEEYLSRGDELESRKEAEGSTVLAVQELLNARMPGFITGAFDRTAGCGHMLSQMLRTSQGFDKSRGFEFLKEVEREWAQYVNDNSDYVQLAHHLDLVVDWRKITEALDAWSLERPNSNALRWGEEIAKRASGTATAVNRKVLEDNARFVARAIIDALRAHFLKTVMEERAKKAQERDLGKSGLLLDPNAGVEAPLKCGGVILHSFPLPKTVDATKLYEIYNLPGPESCPGRSYATALGVVHVLARSVKKLEDLPPSDQPLDRCLLLWRALIRMQLTIETDDKHLEVIDKTEGQNCCDGTPLLLKYKNEVVGFWSPELGCVPHADMIDDQGEPSETLKQAFELLTKALEATKDDDLLTLGAFAVLHGGPSITVDVAPWRTLLLLCVKGAFLNSDSAKAHLNQVAIPSRPMKLETDSHGQAATLPYPMVLDAGVLSMLKKVNATNDPRITIDPDQGLVFKPFGQVGPTKGIAGVCDFDGTKVALNLASASLDEAAQSVRDDRNTGRIKTAW